MTSNRASEASVVDPRLTVVESAAFALERAFRTTDPCNAATSAELRAAARLYADHAAARCDSAARQVEDIMRIARRAGVSPSKEDGRLGATLAWCAERHAERACTKGPVAAGKPGTDTGEVRELTRRSVA
jgi:hypothetical protein